METDQRTDPSKPPPVFVCGCYGFESRGHVNQTRYSATKVFKTGFVFSWLDPMYLYSRKFILRKEYNVEKLLSVHCFLLLELLIKMHTICYTGNNNNLAWSVLVFIEMNDSYKEDHFKRVAVFKQYNCLIFNFNNIFIVRVIENNEQM